METYIKNHENSRPFSKIENEIEIFFLKTRNCNVLFYGSNKKPLQSHKSPSPIYLWPIITCIRLTVVTNLTFYLYLNKFSWNENRNSADFNGVIEFFDIEILNTIITYSLYSPR